MSGMLSLVLVSASKESTHCHAAIHGPSLWCVDKEENQSRDKYKGSEDNNVHLLKLAQRSSIILIEDHKKDIDGRGKRPEYICQWKPATIFISDDIAIDRIGLPNSERTSGDRTPETGITLNCFPHQAR